MKNSTRFVANLAKWSRGMIRALGARGPGFESPFGPHILLVENTGRDSANVFFQWKCTCFLHQRLRIIFFPAINTARLAQSVEHETLNLRVVGSSPTLGGVIFTFSSYYRSLRPSLLKTDGASIYSAKEWSFLKNLYGRFHRDLNSDRKIKSLEC